MIAAAKRLQDEVLSPSQRPSLGTGPLAAQQATVGMCKKVALASLGLAMQTYGERLSDQQEVLTLISDILMDTYGAESVVLRAQRATDSNDWSAELHARAASGFVNDAAARIEVSVRSVVAAMAEGDALRTHLAMVRRLLKTIPENMVAIRRSLAEQAMQQAGYIF